MKKLEIDKDILLRINNGIGSLNLCLGIEGSLVISITEGKKAITYSLDEIDEVAVGNILQSIKHRKRDL